MTQHKNFKFLIIVMALACLLVAAVSIISLYLTAFDQHKLRLVETVKSQARLIEAIAGFNAFANGNNIDDEWKATTIYQVKTAHSRFEGFGKTGEFTLARKSGTQIEFVLNHRHSDVDTPRAIPFKGKWAQPMRLALSGQSGTIAALDYRGALVLAAYEPVDILNLGLVAKIDMAEIRQPFIHASLIALGVSFIVVLLASRLFFKITRPITQQIEQQAETFRTLAETSREGIILINTEGKIEYINPSAEAMFGYARNELNNESVSQLMPRSVGIGHNSYIDNYLKTSRGKIIGTGRQLTGQKKDGSQFPMYLSIGDINLEHTRLFAGVIMDISDQQQLQREIMDIPVREQRRIGQELHDGIGQQLTGLGMLATSLLNKASRPEYNLASQLATGLQEALAQVRALSHGLVPVEIDADGFITALKNLTERIQQQSHILIIFETHSDIQFSNNTTIMHLYRIAQEALNNAIKHANCSQIWVSLDIENDEGLLDISDNGQGFSEKLINNDGLGLSIMKYRSNLFEGDINIDPAKTGGIRVRCRFPLSQAAETM